jgi:predicted nucleic acid-binding protein
VHVVDTNVLLELARPRPAPAVLLRFAAEEAIAISAISLG